MAPKYAEKAGKKLKRIGILGGISHASTIKYYETIIRKYFEKNNDYHFPEIVILSLDFQKFTDLENRDKEGYVRYILKGVRSLESAGAEFVIMAANSPHAVFDEVKRRAKVPMISIVEATAKKAKTLGMKKLLLLGIKFTMRSSFHQDVCRKYGIDVTTPSEQEQDEIDRIIFKELVLNDVRESSRKRLLETIGKHKTDGVILGCTELPLILRQSDTKIRLLNTLEIHAEAALEHSLGIGE